MSRLVIPLLILLLFAPVASAVYSVKLNGYFYVVSYKVYSNGTAALINAEIDNTGTTCDMTGNCWMSVYGGYEYLLYYNGSRLFLLNFTWCPPTMPIPAYVNGTWYLNVTACGILHYVYRLNLTRFCINEVTVNWSRLSKNSTFTNTINGWKLVIPKEFLPSPGYGPFRAYFFVGVNSSVTKPTSVPPFLAIPPHSKLPVYFLLEKDGQVKNVTLFYINATENLTGFWLPESVKIVNVTFCKPIVAPENATSNGTIAQTTISENTTLNITNTSEETNETVTSIRLVNTTRPSPTAGGNTTSLHANTTTTSVPTKKNICGPAFVILAAITVLLLRRHRN